MALAPAIPMPSVSGRGTVEEVRADAAGISLQNTSLLRVHLPVLFPAEEVSVPCQEMGKRNQAQGGPLDCGLHSGTVK